MSVKIIYFVHGTTIDNENKIATGNFDGALSKLGKERVLKLAKQINFEKIDFAISSDLKRAVDSAKYLFEGKKQILYDRRIRECDYGKLNGKENCLIKYEDHIDTNFPEGESLKDVERRVRDFCKYLLKEYDGKNIAIVSHKAPQLALEVITKNIRWEYAIENDWRKTKNWKPGWKYEIRDDI